MGETITAPLMSDTALFWTIVGMFVVTYVPRMVPMQVLAKRDLTGFFADWLGQVPAAVLAALLAPALLLPDGHTLALSLANLPLLAAIPAFAIAMRTGSFFGTVGVGMGVLAMLRLYQL